MSAHLHQQLQNLSYAVRQQQQALGELQGQVATNSIKSANIQQPEKPLQIEDIPGIRTPKWYVVDVEFTKGDNSVRFNSAEIAPDGPFIITQCSPWWRVTDTTAADFYGPPVAAPTGRLLPCSATPFLLNSGITSIGAYQTTTQTGNDIGIGSLFDATGVGDKVGSLSDIPEFSFQIEIAGSGRYWTNLKVPAAAFYGWGGQPNYMGIQGWVERTDRITVHCSPEVAIPHDGKVQFVFEGYQILGPINLAEQLSVSG